MNTKLERIYSDALAISAFLIPALLLTTKNFSVAVIILLIALSIIYIVRDRKYLTNLNKLDYLLLFSLSIYFIVNIPIFITDLSDFRYFKGGIRLLLCIPIYIMAINILEQKSIDRIVSLLKTGVVIGSFGTFFIALYQFLILKMGRVDGFLFSINFGYLACSLAFLALCLAKEGQYKKLLILSFFASCIACTLTLTRGAIFAIPLLLIGIILIRYKEIKLTKLIAATIAFLAVSYSLYIISPDIRQRVNFTVQEATYISDGDVAAAASTGGRLELWEAAIEAFKKSPIIGLNYKEREILNQKLYKEHRVDKWVTTVQRGHAHNQYFEMIASNGTLGVLGFIGMLFLPMAIFFLHFKKTGSLIGYTGTVFVAGWAIFGLTEVPLSANSLAAFYGYILAVFLAIIRVERYGSREKHPIRVSTNR